MGGILASLITGPIINSFIKGAIDAVSAYNDKKITREELEARVRQCFLEAFAEVEKAWAESYARTFEALMNASAKSPTVARIWGFVVVSQTCVLLWVQLGIPAFVYFVCDGELCWPSMGTTADWAYLLVAAALGAGAVMLKPKVVDWAAVFNPRR